MTTETIALLTILRDETQSRDVLARCDAEIERLAKPAPVAAWNVWRAHPVKANLSIDNYVAAAERFWTTHPPKADVVIIRDGQEVRIK